MFTLRFNAAFTTLSPSEGKSVAPAPRLRAVPVWESIAGQQLEIVVAERFVVSQGMLDQRRQVTDNVLAQVGLVVECFDGPAEKECWREFTGMVDAIVEAQFILYFKPLRISYSRPILPSTWSFV